jgi:hypothetical protein
MTAHVSSSSFEVPQLGPALGRLVAPPLPPPGTPPHWIALDDIRLTLVTELFESAGEARQWARQHDQDLALAALGREAWAKAWERATGSVAERASQAITERLDAAAREARLPRRRRRKLPIDDAERRFLAARLRRDDAPFHRALEELDHAVHLVRGSHRSAEACAAYQDSLRRTARRLEAAWLSLEAELRREWLEWEAEVQAVRAWRRPSWPLWVAGAGLFGVGLWIGLMLGGYLLVPAPLRGFAEAIWARWN